MKTSEATSSTSGTSKPTTPGTEPATACAIALGSFKDGDIMSIPGGLKGTEVFGVVSLRRIGFGSDSGDRFVGAQAYVEDAGVDPASGLSQLRIRALSAWERSTGTALTHEERAQILLFRRSDFGSFIRDDIETIVDLPGVHVAGGRGNGSAPFGDPVGISMQTEGRTDVQGGGVDTPTPFRYRVLAYIPSSGPETGETQLGSVDFPTPGGFEMREGDEIRLSIPPHHPNFRGKVVHRTFDMVKRLIELRVERIPE